MKKIIAIVITLITIFGAIFSFTGLGGVSLADKMSLGLDMIGGVSVVLEAQTEATGSELKQIMDQVQAVMENRINEMGLSEPVIAVENENRIRIELPGAQNAKEAIDSIGRTARLSFITADGKEVISGENVKNAIAAVYQGNDSGLIGTYTVNLEFDAAGADAFSEATRKIVEGKISSTTQFNARQIVILLDDEVISQPFVQSIINSTSCQITGPDFTASSTGNLAALIRGGALPVALAEVETEIVGPTLGIDAARMSAIAGAIGILLIFVLMIIGYGVMGIVADITLALYTMIILWIYAGFGIVLTLPGIAGLILSVGMAVDSNVIIFTRIKEEITIGKTVRVAVSSGFKRAMATILDSQITTIIAAIVLYQFGTGSVRGFALTLLIGIVVSLLTAVAISQLMLNVIAESKALGKPQLFRVKEVGFLGAEVKEDYKYDFLGRRKIFYIVSASIIVLGIGLGLIRGFNFGIDFTGGTMLQLNNGKVVELDAVNDVLSSHGISADIQFAGESNQKIIIKTTDVIDNDLRSVITSELRERLGITVNEAEYIEQAGLIGPSVGTQLKSNAIKACIIAGIAILIYVAIRFELRFGIAAVMALIHDTLMLFAVYGILHIQMNSPFIAGLLIVIGYSINDTIVIFDRIRENINTHKKTRMDTICNLSINQSISRSIMTSLTTLIAILPMLIMCGSAIREFVIPLIAGVVFGTVSSLCLATAFYFDLVRLTKKNRYKG